VVGVGAPLTPAQRVSLSALTVGSHFRRVRSSKIGTSKASLALTIPFKRCRSHLRLTYCRSMNR